MSNDQFQKVKINLPKDDYTHIEFSQDEKPGMMTVNSPLKDFDQKTPFAWHLSVVVIVEERIKDDMPSADELKTLIEFEEKIDKALRANGNALYLASITQAGEREMIWRVYNPETANDYLHDLIEAEDHPRPFEFSLEQDIPWNSAKFPLESLDGEYKENKLD